MNTKIFNFLTEKLQEAFSLPKYEGIVINGDTVIKDLPWTPARFEKFQESIKDTLSVTCDFNLRVVDAVNELDTKYLHYFFGSVWKPHTNDYYYTGQALADEVNKHSPSRVLDVGCGYNEFKSKIPNLIGIDPYNNAADYMVDILDFTSSKKFDAIIALGSINFGSFADINEKFSKCVSLLETGGYLYMRVNPGLQHKNGPWVEIFKWTFEIANTLADKYNLILESYKTDLDRVYIVYQKSI